MKQGISLNIYIACSILCDVFYSFSPCSFVTVPSAILYLAGFDPILIRVYFTFYCSIFIYKVVKLYVCLPWSNFIYKFINYTLPVTCNTRFKEFVFYQSCARIALSLSSPGRRSIFSKVYPK